MKHELKHGWTANRNLETQCSFTVISPPSSPVSSLFSETNSLLFFGIALGISTSTFQTRETLCNYASAKTGSENIQTACKIVPSDKELFFPPMSWLSFTSGGKLFDGPCITQKVIFIRQLYQNSCGDTIKIRIGHPTWQHP